VPRDHRCAAASGVGSKCGTVLIERMAIVRLSQSRFRERHGRRAGQPVTRSARAQISRVQRRNMRGGELQGLTAARENRGISGGRRVGARSWLSVGRTEGAANACCGLAGSAGGKAASVEPSQQLPGTSTWLLGRSCEEHGQQHPVRLPQGRPPTSRNSTRRAGTSARVEARSPLIRVSVKCIYRGSPGSVLILQLASGPQHNPSGSTTCRYRAAHSHPAGWVGERTLSLVLDFRAPPAGTIRRRAGGWLLDAPGWASLTYPGVWVHVPPEGVCPSTFEVVPGAPLSRYKALSISESRKRGRSR
jgi:hypothetical protein